jgi:hypothetical protein
MNFTIKNLGLTYFQTLRAAEYPCILMALVKITAVKS